MKHLLTSLLLLTVISAAGQELDRQVEVTKAYIPTTHSAEKMSIDPQMEDTVALRPEGTYQIRSVAWQTDFAVVPIAAATLDARLRSREPQFSLRAGAGWPLGSRVDAALHHPFHEGYAGGWINHRGQFADLDNDLLEPTATAVAAASTTNALGAYLFAKAARQLSLKAEIDADWDFFTRYGQAHHASNSLPTLSAPSIQSYLRGGGKVSIGNDFEQHERFSYRLTGGVHTFADRFDNGQDDFSVALALGYRIGASRILLETEWNSRQGRGDLLADYRNTLWSLRPTYEFARSRFDFLVGASIVGDRIEPGGVDDLYVFPRASVRWDLAGGHFVPFLEVDGRVDNNGPASLTRRNPYMLAGEALLHNTATYEGLIGIAGSVDGAFAYRLYGGGAIITNHVYFDYIYDLYPDEPSRVAGFTPDRQDVAQWRLGAELSANIAGNIELRLEGRKYFNEANAPEGMIPGGDEEPAELPEWQAGFGLRYTLRDRLVASAGLDAVGPRYFYARSFADPDARIDTQLDAHVKVDFQIDARWGVWAEGQNLLGQELYPYHHYRLPRTVMVGVSLKL